jgi:predicted ABC-type ATPase
VSISADRPLLLVVAGPNGSGKSSTYQGTNVAALNRTIWIINPDLLADRIAVAENLDLAAANLESVLRIEAWLEASIRALQTVGVETVLSTPKYRRLVTMAKAFGFDFFLIYVLLDSVELNIERVRLRVSKGGHAVAEDKIRKRHKGSLEQLPWFLEQADEALLLDNSGSSPRLVGTKSNGLLQIDEEAPPILRAALRSLISS